MAPSSSRLRIADDALRRARDSKYRPSTMKAMMSAAVSKYRSPPVISRADDKPKAANVPNATSVSIDAARWRARTAADRRNGQPAQN